jgi:parvulin-like peptidyl-prolyl isomerase
MNILQYWKIGAIAIIAIAVLAAAGYIKILKSDIEVLESEKVVLNQALAISKQSVIDLSAAIDKQNTAISIMKKESDERQKKYLEDIAKAKKFSDGLKKQAEDLMKRTLPQNTNACNAANSLIIEELNHAE